MKTARVSVATGTALLIAGASTAAGQVTATAEQLLINQRISQAAILRADAIEDVLADIGPEWIRDQEITRSELSPEILTQGEGIAGLAAERENALRVRRPSRSGAGSVDLSASQLLINQRISQAAVARANALEDLLEGKLNGGNLADGAIGEQHLAEGLLIGLVRPSSAPPPAEPEVIPPRRSGGNVRLSTAQLAINQLISQAAIRRLNSVRDELESGLQEDNFADGTITSEKLAPPLRTPPPGIVRENPVPVGQSRDVPGGWSLTVLGSNPNATAEVLAENQFNDPPAPGRQFFMTRVRVTRTAADPQTFFDSLEAVGPSNVSYQTFTDFCGVIPEPLPSSNVFQGGTIEGNVCWSVQSSDAGQLTMIHKAGDGTATYFRTL